MYVCTLGGGRAHLPVAVVRQEHTFAILRAVRQRSERRGAETLAVLRALSSRRVGSYGQFSLLLACVMVAVLAVRLPCLRLRLFSSAGRNRCLYSSDDPGWFPW